MVKTPAVLPLKRAENHDLKSPLNLQLNEGGFDTRNSFLIMVFINLHVFPMLLL